MFSGGKDSTALLGLFELWKKTRDLEKVDNFVIHFSDTRLESTDLYRLIDNIESFYLDSELEFVRLLPEKSYWYWQYVYGLPVPDHFNRWCTGRLKITPSNIAGKEFLPITGRPLGELKKRDKTLSKKNRVAEQTNVE